MRLLFISIIMSMTVGSQSLAKRNEPASLSRAQLVRDLQVACETNGEGPGDKEKRKKVCVCIVNEYKNEMNEKDLQTLILLYSKKLEIIQPIDDSLSILLGYDADTAQKCLDRVR